MLSSPSRRRRVELYVWLSRLCTGCIGFVVLSLALIFLYLKTLSSSTTSRNSFGSSADVVSFSSWKDSSTEGQDNDLHPLLLVVFWSSISGLSTGIGGLFVYWTDITQEHNAAMLGFAGGVMIALSLLDMLLPVALEFGALTACLAFAFGVLFTRVLSNALADHEVSWEWLRVSSSRRRSKKDSEAGGDQVLPLLDPSISHGSVGENISNSVAGLRRPYPHIRTRRDKLLRSALLTTISLALHNAPEGVAVGLTVLSDEKEEVGGGGGDAIFASSVASSSSSPPAAKHHVVLIVLAIVLHNIPEGVAVATALFQATKHRYLSFVVATFTGLVEPISAVLAVLLLNGAVSSSSSNASSSLDNIRFASQVSLAAVGGVMVQVSLAELVPQARDASKTHAVAGLASGVLAVILGLCMLGTLGFD